MLPRAKKHLGASPLKLKTSVVNIRSTSKTIMLAKAESTNLMTEILVKKIVQIMPRNISWQWKLRQVNWKNVFFLSSSNAAMSLFQRADHVRPFQLDQNIWLVANLNALSPGFFWLLQRSFVFLSWRFWGFSGVGVEVLGVGQKIHKSQTLNFSTWKSSRWVVAEFVFLPHFETIAHLRTFSEAASCNLCKAK